MLAKALMRIVVSEDGTSISLPILSLANFAKELVSVLPIVLPIVITVIALRKGIRFLFSTLRGA